MNALKAVSEEAAFFYVIIHDHSH